MLFFTNPNNHYGYQYREKIEAKKAEFEEELLNNKALWKHYSEYQENSVKSLIDMYALYKARLAVQRNYTQYHHEYVLGEWTDQCWFALGEIQSKKLFDLQCRWRAGEIDDLPGIKWTHGFESLQIPILEYEAIPQVTEEDIDHYINYLRTPVGQPSFETDWAMDYLSRCYPDSVPMPAAFRWQDAIQNAALDHITVKMQEKLHGTYEEYLVKKQLGTSIGAVKGEDTMRNSTILRLLEMGE